MTNYSSVYDALNDLKKRGYDTEFEEQSEALYSSLLDMRLFEEEFHIDEVYRFDGDSNHNHKAVVYAFTSSTGVKGTIVDDRIII